MRQKKKLFTLHGIMVNYQRAHTVKNNNTSKQMRSQTVQSRSHFILLLNFCVETQTQNKNMKTKYIPHIPVANIILHIALLPR